MAAQLIGAERRLAEFGRGGAAGGRVQVGQMARRRRTPGAEAGQDGEAWRADTAGLVSSAGLTGAARRLVGGAWRAGGPGPAGLAGRGDLARLAGGPGLAVRSGLVGGAGPVRADAAIRPGKGRHWGSISARRAWPLQRFNDICPLAWLTWGK
jgi:hypothetical protein